ncbi:N-6 DNA methylase [Phormidium sp. LEGE 05292]|uniref:HsdM family class I SAM-dependent methyltransferase n=1 Tax=[Phormidium] sp. LEGE 05292 TaxID=767427 RepID=UPI0018820E2B|nr:N-6 DNA methylase [Phormidium sp. LEGE 05292]MBE9224773.1 N-6 DNA methylase [Phormidium sp. LEGE 05292]
MSSRSTTEILYQRVMEETGFYRNGVPTSGVIEAESLRNNNQQLEKRIKYSAVIDPNQINATAIFELSGSPCIYFTQLDRSDPDPRELARLHKLSWNHGLAPMLWVVTPTNVRLYNCYSEPTEDDPNRNLIKLFENTEASLKQLNEHASRLQIESGEFWKWQNARQIDRKKRVDRVLVEDLQEAEKKLREQGLESQVAHALLMQSIFVAYLQDRGILDAEFFQSHFNVDSFIDLLDDSSATSRLFEWLQVTFNGDMFPVASSRFQNSYKAKHLETIKDLVGGTIDIKTGQGRLWRFYDFKVIPVELISSIYENFLYSKDSKTAEETSVHYTPVNLVDLVLDEVFQKLDGGAKILDLACGSGLFLVESLRRLVVKRCVSGEEPSRQLIRETLYNQIYGVDIEPQAVQIAAFSLYLTALELDRELEQYKHLLSNLKFQPLIGRNLFSCDAFDDKAAFNSVEALANKKIHAIVGNPPWTKSKFTKSASKYCQRKRPEQGYPKGYPLAYGDPPDQAFLWRASDFSNENTQIGLILHARAFFSNFSEAKEAKEALLMHFKPRVIINLSKLYRENLFPNSEAPALILIAEGYRSEARDFCYFVCPQRSVDYRKHGILEIGAENIKKLPVSGVASDADMLKIATWGGARDLALIQRLRESFQSIEKVAEKPFRNGFKLGNCSQEVPQAFKKKKWLPSGVMPKYRIDAATLDVLPYSRLEAPRDYQTYKAPLVIVPEKVESTGIFSAFSSEDIVYPKSYYGLSISEDSKSLAHYLNGIINSSLTSYFLFMTASSWGVARKTLMMQDIARLPVPSPTESNAHIVSQIIDLEKRLIEHHNTPTHLKVKKKLDDAVFSLYGLDETEQILVNDAVSITIDLYMNREESAALQRPQISELELYAIKLISVIQPFLQTLRQRVLVADVIEVSKSPLQVVKFSFVPAPGREQIVQTTQVQELKTILNRIAEQLPKQIAERVYTRRDLRIYTNQDIYIIKPAQKRYWSRSAGLNDADLILSEHLRVNRAAIG